MKAEAVIYALLSGAGPVTSIVGTRIYPALLPLGVAVPAIVYELISSVHQGRIDAAATTHLYRSRMQINLLASKDDYALLLTLRGAVIDALRFQRGAISGATVHTISPDTEGAITFDEQTELFHRPLDFIVHHSA